MTERDDDRTRRAEALLHHLSCAESIEEERAIALRFGDDERRAAFGFAADVAEARGATPELIAWAIRREATRLASPPDGEPAGGAESSYDDELTEWELHTAVRIAAHHGGLHDARVAVHQLVAMAHARGMVYGAALAEPPTPSAPCLSNSQEDSNALASPGAAEPHSLSQAKRFAVQRGEDPAAVARAFRKAAKCLRCRGDGWDREKLDDGTIRHGPFKCRACNGTGAPRASDGGGAGGGE